MSSNQKYQQGFIMFYVLGIVTIIIFIAGSYFAVATSDLVRSYRAANLMKAYYVADAGLADAFMQLRAAVSPPATLTASCASYSVGSTGIGSYTAQATTDHAARPTYTIVSEGTYAGCTRTLTLTVKAASFSRYGYLSNTEIDPVWGGNWYITGMISTGPTCTNGQFNMYGTPVFEGAVSQAASAVNYWIGPPTDDPDYQRGLTVGATPISMPTVAESLNPISAAALESDGLYLTGDSAITLVQNGTMNVTNSDKGWISQNMPIPANGALFVQGGTATVQGVLKGQLTVGSDTDIYISGNIVYNTDPRTDPSSTDMLGLVAQNNVQVTSSGPQNMEVDAYIMAIAGQFSVEDFWTFAKGDLVQMGGLTTNLPGGLTGLFDPSTGQVVFGYNQLQYFDDRFKTQAPAWFPLMKDTTGRIAYGKISLYEN